MALNSKFLSPTVAALDAYSRPEAFELLVNGFHGRSLDDRHHILESLMAKVWAQDQQIKNLQKSSAERSASFNKFVVRLKQSSETAWSQVGKVLKENAELRRGKTRRDLLAHTIRQVQRELSVRPCVKHGARFPVWPLGE